MWTSWVPLELHAVNVYQPAVNRHQLPGGPTNGEQPDTHCANLSARQSQSAVATQVLEPSPVREGLCT